MQLGYESIALVGLIVVFAYTVVGTTGFGASITSVPLLVHLLPLTSVVPMMVVLDLCAGMLIVGRNFRTIDRRELLRLLPFMLAGIALGVTVLVSAPERLLLLGARHRRALLCRLEPLGTHADGTDRTGMVAAARHHRRRLQRPVRHRRPGLHHLSRAAHRRQGSPAGDHQHPDLPQRAGAARSRSSLPAPIAAELLPLIALMVPCMLLGLYAGSRLHHRLPAKQVIRIVWSLLLVSGTSLIWRSL